MQLKIGSFNVYNLVRVGVPYYDKPPYSPEELVVTVLACRRSIRRRA